MIRAYAALCIYLIHSLLGQEHTTDASYTGLFVVASGSAVSVIVSPVVEY